MRSMSVKVEHKSPQAEGRREVSGSVVNAVIGLVGAHGGDAGVSQALALAGERRPYSDLADTGAWSSITQAAALFDAAASVTADGAIGLHVGRTLLRPTVDGFVDRVLTAGSTEAVLHQVGALLGHFDGTSEAVLLEVEPDHALVRVSPLGRSERHAHLCEMTRGLLTQVPVAFGSGEALITEAECSARGGRHCLYAMSWDDHPDRDGTAPDASAPPTEADRETTGSTERPAEAGAERSGAELDRMRTLMEGTFATALGLLDDDSEVLLSEIAARADALVTAPRYLLMVRIRPGTPVKLHHRGLAADEAQALAAELWPGHPDDAHGTRLVVDIASGRHRYGRLVELVPSGDPITPSEGRLLRLYADYAATALDILGVLDDARRSDTTARTLLSFAESLSGVTTPADLVQLLADTVPTVAACDRSTVYLWEVDSGQLVPRARSAGSQPPDAYLGPIVPLAVPGPGPVGRADGRREWDHTITSGAIGQAPSPVGPEAAAGTAGDDPPGVQISLPLVDRLIKQQEVIVIDSSSEDPVLRDLMARSGTAASVVTPLFSGGQFFGVISANYGVDTPTDSIRDPDLHERLSGLADQAATSLQNLGLLEKVSHMAWHDALTGLPNRRLFEDRVEQELLRSRRVGEPVCMFFVDLDHFKRVNDTLGHATGDELIRQVSQRLVDTVRRQDTVARVGGDEFAILLPGLSEQESIDELAARALEVMSLPFVVFGQDVETSASIGIAMAPEHGDSYDDLLSRADEAMYRAKALGRDGFQMFSGPHTPRRAGSLPIDPGTLEAELSEALQRHQFFVVYQPYIDLRTSEVVGVEALVRWHHPRLGILEPPSFISVAERSDLIVALDSWVLEQACVQARAWFEGGLGPFRLSVNLASRDLSDPELFANVDRTLARTGIDPSLLELEITERVVLDRWGPAKENIERLRRLGVRFTIDDFGAGNSSLNRIGSFPVSTLKIDQSFVQVLGPEGEDDSLVSAIISMADRLGLDCVAEGVETSQQSRVLLQRGCSIAQGYYFSPPLAADDIGRLMATISAGEGPVVLGGGEAGRQPA